MVCKLDRTHPLGGRERAAGRRLRRGVADQRRGHAEHDDDERDLGAQRAPQQASGAARRLTAGRQAPQRGHDALAIDGAEANEDEQQDELDEHGAPEGGVQQRREAAHVDQRLRDPGGQQRRHARQRDRREAHQDRRQQTTALGRLEPARGAGEHEEEHDQAADPDAHRRDVDDVERQQRRDRMQRGRVARQRRGDEQERHRHRQRGQDAAGWARARARCPSPRRRPAAARSPLGCWLRPPARRRAAATRSRAVPRSSRSACPGPRARRSGRALTRSSSPMPWPPAARCPPRRRGRPARPPATAAAGRGRRTPRRPRASPASAPAALASAGRQAASRKASPPTPSAIAR